MTSISQTQSRYLIPPFERIQFTGLFVLATGVGWFLIGLILRSVQDPTVVTYLEGKGLLSALVTGFVSGTVVSATQWLVLRRYLPDWLWILAGATGYVLLTTTLEAWWGWLGYAMTLPEVAALTGKILPQTMVMLTGGIRTVLATICSLWLGLAQWLLLRQYTDSSRWWVGVPSIAVVVSALFTAFSAGLVLLNVNFPLDGNVLGAGILGITQAIALCTLQRRPCNKPLTSLTMAPNLDYNQANRLGKRLHQHLSDAWTSEHLNQESLHYWVAVTETGAIAAYKPISQAAIDQVQQTPLPKLVIPEVLHPENGVTPPLAQFDVTFLPSGKLQIHPYSGVPLLWVTLGMLTMIIAASAIVAHFNPALIDIN
ncbi:hypothetical protein AB3R30_17915 [Leptolyngbyaceae cyanobacterium UHCC 1019]